MLQATLHSLGGAKLGQIQHNCQKLAISGARSPPRVTPSQTKFGTLVKPTSVYEIRL